MRYFRVFRLDGGGALASPYGWGPILTTADPAVLEAHCPWHGHTPPHPACMCGMYSVTGWPTKLGIPLLCMVGKPPRVLAEVDPGEVLPDPAAYIVGGVPMYQRYGAVRSRAVRLKALWVPTPGHCWSCRYGRPPQPDLPGAVEELHVRYGVPVVRW